MQFRWSCKMDTNESVCVGNIILISLYFQFARNYLFRDKFWIHILSKQWIQISHHKVIFLATESKNWAFVVITSNLWNQWLELEIKGQKLQFSRENIALGNKVKASALNVTFDFTELRAHAKELCPIHNISSTYIGNSEVMPLTNRKQ